MALRHGRRVKADDGDRALFAFGRSVGFVALTVVAMGALAAVVLVPELARLRQLQYRRDCLAIPAAEAVARNAVRERMLDAAANDPVLTRRQAMRQLRYCPRNEAVVGDSTPPPVMPGAVYVPQRRRPTPPSPRLIGAAARLQRPATRRGLLLLAVGTLVAALFLFAPPQKRRPSPTVACLRP